MTTDELENLNKIFKKIEETLQKENIKLTILDIYNPCEKETLENYKDYSFSFNIQVPK